MANEIIAINENAQNEQVKNEKVVTGYNYERKMIKENEFSANGCYRRHYDAATDDFKQAMIPPKEFMNSDEWAGLRREYYTLCKEVDSKKKNPNGLVSMNTCYNFIWKRMIKVVSKSEVDANTTEERKLRIQAAKRCVMAHKIALQAEAEANRL